MRVWIGVMALAGILTGTPAAGQSFEAFGNRPSATLTVPAFSDDELVGLLTTLERLLEVGPGPANSEEDAGTVLWQFARRLQSGRLTPTQERMVLDQLDRLTATRPGLASSVAAPRRMITGLTVGKIAPNIIGTDLDGRPLRLSEHRGKVVVLVFSAEWCAICKTQAPYERFLLDRYTNWPVAVLGVQTGSSREAARLAQSASPLSHRSWWDVPAKGETSGPIASAWNVAGWPANYVIDGDGVIRFVDVRDEDLLKAVRQLVEAQLDRDARTPKRTK